MADHAPCSASTTQPLFAKSEGFEASAIFSRDAHRSRRSASMCCRPIRASSTPVRMACRMARHHRTQASPASGS